MSKRRLRIFAGLNSSGNDNKIWIAEIVGGTEINLQTEEIPAWFQKYILDKI